MILSVNDPVIGAYLIDTEGLKYVNAEAWANGWSARWSDESELLAAVDPVTNHVVVPMMNNGGDPQSFRCYVWFYKPGLKSRRCVMMDVSAQLLSQFPCMQQRDLEALVALLFDQLPLTATT